MPMDSEMPKTSNRRTNPHLIETERAKPGVLAAIQREMAVPIQKQMLEDP